MGERTTKNQGSKSSAALENVPKDNGKAGSSFQFKDNRPEAVSQRKLQGMANDYADKQDIPMQRKENNTGLPDNLKSGIENLSGHSMDDVKVHYNSDKPAQLNAHAYAQGTNIHLGSGQEKHLPHEAWHVVQQKQGRVRPTMQLKDKVNINDDEGLEKEADVMGARALQMKSNTTSDLASNPLIQLMINDPLLANVIIQGKFEMDPKMVEQLSSVIQLNGWEIAGTSAEIIDYLLDFVMAVILVVEGIQDDESSGISMKAMIALSVTSLLSLLNTTLQLIAELKTAKSKKDTAIAITKITLMIATVIPVIALLSTLGFSVGELGILLSAFIAFKKMILAGPEALKKIGDLIAQIKRAKALSENTALISNDIEMQDQSL